MKGENMDKNELLEEQEFIIWKKFEEFKKAYCEFIKNIDIGIYFDEFDEIDEIEVEDFELLWNFDSENFNYNGGKELREYNNFEHIYWLIQQHQLLLDEITKGGDERKAYHRNKKQIELLIRNTRWLKHESERVIEKENEVIAMANDELKFLDELRNNL